MFAVVRPSDGLVVNVVELDTSTEDGKTWSETMSTSFEVTEATGRVGVGFYKKANGTFVPAPSLSASTDHIPADGTTPSVLSYSNKLDNAPSVVTFNVNGATVDVTLVNGVAELNVTSAQPDTIVVTCGGFSLTITSGA